MELKKVMIVGACVLALGVAATGTAAGAQVAGTDGVATDDTYRVTTGDDECEDSETWIVIEGHAFCSDDDDSDDRTVEEVVREGKNPNWEFDDVTPEPKYNPPGYTVIQESKPGGSCNHDGCFTQKDGDG